MKLLFPLNCSFLLCTLAELIITLILYHFVLLFLHLVINFTDMVAMIP